MEPLILVIDDNPHEAGLICFVLADIGIPARVMSAATGEQGLELLRSDNALLPQLIVLDQQMPGMWGTDVLNELVRDERFSRIPVLHWSSDAATDLHTAFGHHTCGRKPSSLDEYRSVFEMLRGILESRRPVAVAA